MCVGSSLKAGNSIRFDWIDKMGTEGNKSEILSTKFETNSKSKCSNVSNLAIHRLKSLVLVI